MMIQLEMGSEFARTVQELGEMGGKVLAGAARGLARGMEDVEAHVQQNYLSGQALGARTGNLRRAGDGWMEGPLHAVVGVREGSAVDRYKWLLGDEQKTITPKRANALTIPIGEALTASGVAKYASVAEAARELGATIFRPAGKNVLGYVRGKTGRGKFRPLFVLVKSVMVQGSGALYDGVMDKIDDIGEAMERGIAQEMQG